MSKLQAETEEEDEESSGDEENESEKAVSNKELEKARKKWLGEDIKKGSGSSSSTDAAIMPGQYQLLVQKEKKVTKETSVEDLVKAMVEGGQKIDLQTMINLELMKNLKKKGRDNEDSGEEGEVTQGVNAGAGKSIAKWHQSRKHARANPIKMVKEFVEETKLDLGVRCEGVPWQITDLTKKIPWGKHRILGRAHFMEINVLSLILEGKYELAALQAVQNCRCLRQIMIDDGKWKVGWMLTHLEDPWLPKRFGGREADLEVIASYIKSIEELEKKTKSAQGQDGKKEEYGEGEGEGGESWKKKGKKKE